jgi:1,4-dihydroxy-2-naphthoate octaprenyltransferase
MTTSQPNSQLAGWIAATRPRVFVASFVPMALAGVIALQDGIFANENGTRNLVFFLLALIGVMLLQTVANLVNEYADFYRGADELKQAGQGMAIKKHGLTPQAVRNGAIFCGVAGVLIGLFLLSQSGPWLWAIGIGGVLVAITYTAGPFPLAYNGLGEVAAGIFMGPLVVLGAYYVMQPNISAEKGLWLCLQAFPIMFTTAAILHANNIRDIDADRSVNKRTLAVMFGIETARLEYKLLLAACYGSQFVLIFLGMMPAPTLLTLMTVPEARRLIGVIDTETQPLKLHIAQGQTARLHGRIGLLLVVGWLAWLVFQQFAG